MARMCYTDRKETIRRTNMANRSNSLFGGVLLILAGLIFLSSNFNLVPLTFWKDLWKFWPVILILLGLKQILDK